MPKNVEDIRNVALVGHGSSGKTTLADRLLVKTGAVNANPSVDDGTSICDFDEEEKHHKYSIEAAITHFEHAGKHFNLVDTPGYPDLIGQAIGALRAVETAVVAIDAQAGIKVNTRRMWDEAGKAGVGRIIALTKLDAENINFEGLIESIQEVFGGSCQLLNVPIGQGSGLKGVASTLSPPSDTRGALIDPSEIREALIESIVEVDEAVMERYLEGEMPSADELSRLLVQAISEGKLTPIVCLSTKNNIGVDEFLETLSSAALPPSAVKRTAKKDGDEVALKPDPSAPLAAQVFKTRIDPFVQKLSFIRIYSGTIKRDSTIASPGARKGIKIGPLFRVQASETAQIDEAIAGEIVAVAKCEELHTGTSIGEVECAPLAFPRPMVGLAVSP
jgi:elongation factor G